MAVLVKVTKHGVTPEQYAEIAKNLIPTLQRQPGFSYHFAYFENGDIAVNEIWDSVEQHRAWFDGTVRPNLPPGHTPQVDVTDLFYSAAP